MNLVDSSFQEEKSKELREIRYVTRPGGSEAPLTGPEPITLERALELLDTLSTEARLEHFGFRDEDGEMLEFHVDEDRKLYFTTPLMGVLDGEPDWTGLSMVGVSVTYSQCVDALKAFFQGYVSFKRLVRTLPHATVIVVTDILLEKHPDIKEEIAEIE